MSNFLEITVPADGLAPTSAKPLTSTVISDFMPCVCMAQTLETLADPKGYKCFMRDPFYQVCVSSINKMKNPAGPK